MSEIERRRYQTDAVNRFFHEVRGGNRRVMLCAPTGAGKMVMAIQLIKHLVERGKRVNFIVDRTVLCRQASRQFHKFGLAHGVEAGSMTMRVGEPVMIRSAQTMRSRDIDVSAANLNIIDEAHITHKHTAKQMEQGVWLGLSASPFKAGLGNLFDAVINVSTTTMLQAEGFLSPLKIFCGVPVEVHKKTSTGEYDIDEAAMSTSAIVGDVVKEWAEKTSQHFQGPVKTIVFGNKVEDCMNLAAAFTAAGYDFRAVSYLDDHRTKERLVRALERGEIMGLVSCEMLQRGFDVPDILCGVDCHPWRKSLSSVVQQCGRAMRISPDTGKEYALWLDHAQNCLRHKDRLMEFWENGLDQLVPMDNKAGKDDPERRDALCPKCEALMMSRVCANCGWERPVRRSGATGEGMMSVDGKLVPLGDHDERKHVAKVGMKEYEMPPPLWGWGGLCTMAREKNKDEDRGQRWCQAQFRRLYGRFHRARYDPAQETVPPTNQLRAAVEHSLELYVAGIKRAERKAPAKTGT